MALRKREIEWYGYKPDLPDNRDLHFSAVIAAPPDVVDERPSCAPVMNQSKIGSCTAHGITGIIRHARIMQGLGDLSLSRLQLYYDERYVEGTTRYDSGAAIRDGMRCAAAHGIADEKLWPYDIARFRVKPTKVVYANALGNMVLKYTRVVLYAGQIDRNILSIKQAIASKHPVVFGITVYENFESKETEATGIVAMPAGDDLGGHCMYTPAYGQKAGYFTVRNSWDTDWGDKGDCYLPEQYLGDTRLCSDCWTVELVK